MTIVLPRVIGLWAPAPQSGKSTSARLLAKHGGTKGTYIRSFAEPLKRMLVQMLMQAGYSDFNANRLIYKDKSEPIVALPGAPTGRFLQQKLGTEWGRDIIHNDLWTEIWLAFAKRALVADDTGTARVITDDVRMLNEAEAVRSLGGEIWAIRRNSTPADTSGHRSEGGLGDFKFDKEIQNDSDDLKLLEEALLS